METSGVPEQCGAPVPALGGAGSLGANFLERGFAVVRGALGREDVAAFVRQLEEELAREPAPEGAAGAGAAGAGAGGGPDGDLLYDRTDIGRVSLHDRRTWPTGKKRRVVECAPFPQALPHWQALRRSERLAQALDDIVGAGCWEMPFNGDAADRHPQWSSGHPPRHWYFPIVFPEHEYLREACGRDGTGGAAGEDAGVPEHAACRPELRKIELHSWRDELAIAPFTSEASDAPARWQPVSRRRFRGKGWHIDVGPGFPNDALRHECGHPFQCVVLLLLLSDSDPGGGGTVMIPGSHVLVEEKLRAEGDAGISHEDLNAWCVEQVLAAIRSGSLALAPGAPPGSACPGLPSKEVEPAARGRSDAVEGAEGQHEDGAGLRAGDLTLPHVATQIVGKAGDVVLMHPLMLHCGSTNLSSRVRIMSNGMVRMKKAVFEERGGMRFATRRVQR